MNFIHFNKVCQPPPVADGNVMLKFVMKDAEKDYEKEIRKILRNRKLSLIAFVMLLPFYLVCGHILRGLQMPEILLAIVIIPYGLILACLGVLNFFSTFKKYLLNNNKV